MTPTATNSLAIPSLTQLLLGGVVLYVFIRYVSTAIHNYRWASKNGCKPVYRIPSYTIGFNHFYDLIKAGRKKMHVQYIAGRYGRSRHRTLAVRQPTRQDNICTIEPANIQTVLATKFKDFGLSDVRYSAFVPLLGEGIFTLDGKGWEHSRALLRPQFSRDQISDLEALEHNVQKFLALFPASGQAFDLQPLFFRLTLDTATDFLFGESVDALNPAAFDSNRSFSNDFNEAQLWAIWRLRFSRFQFLEPKAARDSYARVHAFIDHYVDLALNPAKRSILSSSSRKYIFLHELSKDTSDPIVLRSQMLNILLAGRDTTASLLGWTFFCLARYPQVYSKLRAAIRTAAHGSFTDLKAIPYLRFVLNEVLRLYPVVPVNGRSALTDTVLPVGGGADQKSPVAVAKGQRVQWSVFALHRRKDIYGSDAEHFRPERWETLRVGWEYLPFNGGPRICLGQQFALTEAGYTVARIVERYGRCEVDEEGLRLGGADKEMGVGVWDSWMDEGSGENGDEGWAARNDSTLVMTPHRCGVKFYD